MRHATENVSKLPKWAQSKIQVLEMRVSELKSTLAQLSSKEPTDTIIVNYGVDEPDTNLPNHSHIEFRPKDGDPIEVYLRHDDPTTITVSASRFGGLKVLPVATNVIRICVSR